ncbi:MAG: OmpA family protein [Gammaproteobacteria bacterium]|nr:OmpA family protein [Gammaproteobacteria bacterium]
MKRVGWLMLAGLMGIAGSAPAMADPNLFQHAGASLRVLEEKDYDNYQLIYSPMDYREAKLDDDVSGYIPAKLEEVSGNIKRYVYDYRAQDSALGVARDFEMKAQRAGFELVNQCDRELCGDAAAWKLYMSDRISQNGQNTYYRLARAAGASGKYLYVALFVADVNGKPRSVVHVVDTAAQRKYDGFSAAELRRMVVASGSVELKGVFFESGKSDILPASREALLEIKKSLDDGKYRYYIVGHTDSAGSAEINNRLSLQRAQAVVRYLENEFGSDVSRIEAKGIGALAPKASNATEEGRRLNRRVELVLR